MITEPRSTVSSGLGLIDYGQHSHSALQSKGSTSHLLLMYAGILSVCLYLIPLTCVLFCRDSSNYDSWMIGMRFRKLLCCRGGSKSGDSVDSNYSSEDLHSKSEHVPQNYDEHERQSQTSDHPCQNDPEPAPSTHRGYKHNTHTVHRADIDAAHISTLSRTGDNNTQTEYETHSSCVSFGPTGSSEDVNVDSNALYTSQNERHNDIYNEGGENREYVSRDVIASSDDECCESDEDEGMVVNNTPVFGGIQPVHPSFCQSLQMRF